MTQNARYAFVPFEQDALLLDLGSGNLFQLNEAAALIWSLSLGGASTSRIAEALSDKYDLAPAMAREHVADALVLDQRSPGLAPLSGPYQYHRSASGYMLSREGTPLLQLDDGGRSVALADAEAGVPDDLRMALHTVAPKILALRGQFVLHASAVLLDGGLLAFCGKSGAGKTTTARALARAGATLISEDKLVVRPTDAGLDGLVEGEPVIVEWVTAAAKHLSSGEAAPCELLDQAARGETMPVRELCFLDQSRRSGDAIVTSAIGRAEAARAIFATTFCGSAAPEDWERHLKNASTTARHVSAYEIGLPAGLVALDAALRSAFRRATLRQTEMTAS